MKRKILTTAISALLSVFFLQNMYAQETKPEFKPSGKVWGYLFGDYFYKAGSDTVTTWGDAEFSRLKKDHNAFTFRRAYLGYDYTISENFSSQFLLEGRDDVTITQGSRTVFIKSAYIEWKNLIPRASLLIGQSATPTWSLLTEKVWDYRCVEKTIADFRKLGKASDLGIRLSGDIDTAGTLGYHIMIGNGTGDKKETDQYKKAYLSLWAKTFNKKIIPEIYLDYEKWTDKTRSITLKMFVAYDSKVVTAGVETVRRFLLFDIRGSSMLKNIYAYETGITFFVRGTLRKDKLKAFARFDWFDPVSNDREEGYVENFISAGLEYMPHKSVHLLPNIWINTYTGKSTLNAERKADIVPRISFYYVFK